MLQNRSTHPSGAAPSASIGTPPPSPRKTPEHPSDDLFGRAEPRASAAPKPRIPRDRPVIRDDGQFACAICGAPAHFGFGVKLLAGALGRWSCRDHRDEVQRLAPPKTSPQEPQKPKDNDS